MMVMLSSPILVLLQNRVPKEQHLLLTFLSRQSMALAQEHLLSILLIQRINRLVIYIGLKRRNLVHTLKNSNSKLLQFLIAILHKVEIYFLSIQITNLSNLQSFVTLGHKVFTPSLEKSVMETAVHIILIRVSTIQQCLLLTLPKKHKRIIIFFSSNSSLK